MKTLPQALAGSKRGDIKIAEARIIGMKEGTPQQEAYTVACEYVLKGNKLGECTLVIERYTGRNFDEQAWSLRGAKRQAVWENVGVYHVNNFLELFDEDRITDAFIRLVINSNDWQSR